MGRRMPDKQKAAKERRQSRDVRQQTVSDVLLYLYLPGISYGWGAAVPMSAPCIISEDCQRNIP